MKTYDLNRNPIELIKVIQNPSYIKVEGARGFTIEEDLKTVWRTSKIVNLFRTFQPDYFSFDNFFAPDILYTINLLINNDEVIFNKKALNKIKEGMLNDTWLKEVENKYPDRLDFKKLQDFKYKPLDFQQEFLEYYNQKVSQYRLNGALLDGAPGSGKTFMGLVLSHCLKKDVTIIVCPQNAVLNVWQDAIDGDKCLFKQKQSVHVLGQRSIMGGQRYIILNYERLEMFVNSDYLQSIKNKNINIILDESHNLTDLTALRTAYFIKLCEITKCRDVLLASGTPVKALGSDTIPLFKAIDPMFTPAVQERFTALYGRTATKALDILNHRLGIVSFKITKERLGLLPPIITTVKVKMDNAEKYYLDSISKDMREFVNNRKVYYAERKTLDQRFFDECLNKVKLIYQNDKKQLLELDNYKSNIAVIKNTPLVKLTNIKHMLLEANAYEKNIIIPLLSPDEQKQFKEVKTIIKYTVLKIQGECLGQILGKARVNCHLDMVEYIDFNTIINSTLKKTLVFTSYVEVLEKTQKHLSKNQNPLVVYGKTNSELGSIINEFEKNKNVNPLIATFNSLSTAVPLVMADTMIMLNTPFRDYIYNQTVSRIHRIGADTQTNVYIMQLDTDEIPNISTRSIDILKWSNEQVAMITGAPALFELEEAVSPTPIMKFSAENFDITIDVFEQIKNSDINKPIKPAWECLNNW